MTHNLRKRGWGGVGWGGEGRGVVPTDVVSMLISVFFLSFRIFI